MKFALAANLLVAISVVKATTDRTPTNLNPRHDSLVPRDDHDALASLFGSTDSRDTFFKDHFGADIVHMKRSDADLPPPIENVSMEKLYQSSKLSLRMWGSSDHVDKSEMNFDRFQDYIKAGGSAVAHISTDDQFSSFKKDIEDSLGTIVSMNVYHSGPSGVALAPHTDRYDVFVLHLDGQKEWEICVPDDVLPKDTNINLSSADIADIKEVSLANIKGCSTHEEKSRSTMTCSNTTMTPGDMLYLPKGIVHSATTTAGLRSTTHVTIGLVRDKLNYEDLLKTVLLANMDNLAQKLHDGCTDEETTAALFSTVTDTVVKRDKGGFGLGLRRMMPSWVWAYYGSCTTPLFASQCDIDRHKIALQSLMDSVVEMLDELKAASIEYLHSLENTNMKDNGTINTRPFLGDKPAWLVELDIIKTIEGLKQIGPVHAAIDMHLAILHGHRAQQETEERTQYLEYMTGAERKAETDHIITNVGQDLITELNSGKYETYNKLRELMEDDANELDILEAQRQLSESEACVKACDVVTSVCEGACSVISAGADACKGACDKIFSACAVPFKLADCDGGPCFSDCDGQPCFSGCDEALLCTSDCDSTCFGCCDGWLGVGSCDCKCTTGCDDDCIGSSCDSGCTTSCDGSCTTGCDEYTGGADICFSARDVCYSPCEASEDLAAKCMATCETDSNICSTICGFYEMAVDVVDQTEITEVIPDAVGEIQKISSDITHTINSVSTTVDSVSSRVLEAYKQFDSGAQKFTIDTSLDELTVAGDVSTVLDDVVSVVGVQLGVFAPLMASLSWVGISGMNFNVGIQFGKKPLSFSIGIFTEDANPLSDKALILEICHGPDTFVPTIDAGFELDYRATFIALDNGGKETFADAGLSGSGVTPTLGFGQQISISTNILEFFGFPATLVGSVGWDLADSNGDFIAPFVTIPNSMGFGLADSQSSGGLISTAFAVCGAFGRVTESAIRRSLEKQGSVEIMGKKLVSADSVMDTFNTLSTTRLQQGHRIVTTKRERKGGAKAWKNYKQRKGKDARARRKDFKPSRNRRETRKDHVAGRGPLDRTVSTKHKRKPATPAEVDRYTMKRLVRLYNLYFKDQFGGVSLKKAMKKMSPEQLDILFEAIGGHPDTIEGDEVPGFDDISRVDWKD